MSRSRTELTGRTRRARFARAFGPEPVAAVLSVVIVAVVAAIILTRPIGGSPGAGSSPAVASASPSAAAPSVGPSASLGAVASERPSLTLPPTMANWATDARLLVSTDRRLATARDRLRELAAEDPVSTAAINSALRQMNTSLLAPSITIVAALETAGAPPDLLADLRAAHEAALEASLGTLEAARSNGPAYRRGATAVADALDDLEALMTRVEKAAGLPSASPS